MTKQGTSMVPMLCGGSVGEYLDERNDGASIGEVTIPALAFVDDIVNMETESVRFHMARIILRKGKSTSERKEVRHHVW